jgi:hypothetical protein
VHIHAETDCGDILAAVERDDLTAGEGEACVRVVRETVDNTWYF